MNTIDVRPILKSQYHASLAMLREAIEFCPDNTWYDRTPRNAFWQVVYHTLFFAELYLGESPEAYRGWPGHQAAVQHPDGIPGDADPRSSLPLIADPYTRDQTLEYWRMVDSMVDSTIDTMDLASTESGFYWYKVSKLEHQLVNIRHIQHGAAQLADRLRTANGIGVRWVGARVR